MFSFGALLGIAGIPQRGGACTDTKGRIVDVVVVVVVDDDDDDNDDDDDDDDDSARSLRNIIGMTTSGMIKEDNNMDY